MIFRKKNQVHPLRHKEVMPYIPFERQSLLVQEQLAALGGELDSLSTMGEGDHVEVLGLLLIKGYCHTCELARARCFGISTL